MKRKTLIFLIILFVLILYVGIVLSFADKEGYFEHNQTIICGNYGSVNELNSTEIQNLLNLTIKQINGNK